MKEICGDLRLRGEPESGELVKAGGGQDFIVTGARREEVRACELGGTRPFTLDRSSSIHFHRVAY